MYSGKSSGSEVSPARLSRPPLTGGFLPGPSHRTQSTSSQLQNSKPHTPAHSRGVASSVARRKRSTESIFLEGQDANGKEQQENKRVPALPFRHYHQRNILATSIESVRVGLLRPSTALKSPVAVDSAALKVRQFSATARSLARSPAGAAVASQPPATSSPTSSSAGAFSLSKAKPKQKPPSYTSKFRPLQLQSTNVAISVEGSPSSSGSSVNSNRGTTSSASISSINNKPRSRARLAAPVRRVAKDKGSFAAGDDNASRSSATSVISSGSGAIVSSSASGRASPTAGSQSFSPRFLHPSSSSALSASSRGTTAPRSSSANLDVDPADLASPPGIVTNRTNTAINNAKSSSAPPPSLLSAAPAPSLAEEFFAAADPSDFYSLSASDFSFPTFDALDDLVRWDMDPLPSIPSPPDSPGPGKGRSPTSSSNSFTTSKFNSNALQRKNSPPFSSPFGDDELLADEMPFPSMRGRVVMEDMGVKKTKTLAADKARSMIPGSGGFGGLTTSLMKSRYVPPFMRRDEPTSRSTTPTPPPAIPSSSTRPLLPPPPALPMPSGLPPPLPVPQSANTPSPLNDDSLARTSTYLLPPVSTTTPPTSPSPSALRNRLSELPTSTRSGSPTLVKPLPLPLAPPPPLNPQSSPSPARPPRSRTLITTDTSPASSSSLNPEPQRSTKSSSATSESPSTSDSGYASPATSKSKSKLRKSSSPPEQRRRSPSKTHKDNYGCVHLGAEDCELAIMFPQTSDFEVWDMSDTGWVSVPALLCVMAKDPGKWTGTPLAMPDVTLIDLRCEAIPLPVPFGSSSLGASARRKQTDSASSTYTTSFSGGKSALDDSSPGGSSARGKGMSMMSALKKREEEQTMSPEKVSIDGKWARTYAKPGVEGPRSRTSSSFLHTDSDSNIKAGSGVILRDGWYAPPRGWYLKAWIPIPTRLFAKRETRVFRISASVWMMGDEERKVKLDRYEVGFSRASNVEEEDIPMPLTAESDMSVSHLRREREMEGWW